MRICRYCGKEIEKGKQSKEHIIPDSLGCNVKIKNVCSACNNETLSNIDNELRTKSPLQYLLYTPERYDWSFNPDFPWPLELSIDTAYDKTRIWPQLLFPGSQYIFFFTPEQGIKPEQFRNTFFNSLLIRIQKLGIKALIWQKIPNFSIQDFPTRIFTRHTFSDINPENKFFCRYIGKPDYDATIDQIIIAERKLKQANANPVITPGLNELSGEFRYDINKVKRALTKIVINTLAFVCSNTEVNHTTFSEAIEFILGKNPKYDISTTWFINNQDVLWMHCPSNMHKIHIEPQINHIQTHIAFLGGKAGAVVNFPGRILEKWRRCELILGNDNSKPVPVKSGVLIQYPTPRITIDPRAIMPSVPFTYLKNTLLEIEKSN